MTVNNKDAKYTLCKTLSIIGARKNGHVFAVNSANKEGGLHLINNVIM